MSLQEFALGARAGFRGLAHEEEELAGRRVEQVLTITRELRELFPGASSILDIASGGGEAVSWYRSLFPGVRLVCLEQLASKFQPTLARFAGVAHYRRFDGVAIPYSDASFDVVTGFGGVAAISAEQRPAALAEMRRVLKPDGLVILFEPTGPGLSGRGVARDLREAGFQDTAVRYRGPVPLLPFGSEFHVVARRP